MATAGFAYEEEDGEGEEEDEEEVLSSGGEDWDNGGDEEERLAFVNERLQRSSKNRGENSQKRQNSTSSPLPLFHFSPTPTDYGEAKTVWGSVIPTIKNAFCEEPAAAQPELLHNPAHSQRLSKWFIARAQKEHVTRMLPAHHANNKDSTACRLVDVVAFQSNGMFDLATDATSSTSASAAAGSEERHLEFSSGFECGNLERATRVMGRQHLMTARALECLRGDYAEPAAVAQEYDLLVRPDLNTSGNIQWYLFSATAHAGDKYPLRVRFNLVNMEKKDSLYNYGMLPATLVRDEEGERGWRHRGQDVCYYKNGKSVLKAAKATGSKKDKDGVRLHQLHSLSFTYTFRSPSTVFFAHAFPYTYSDLQRYLLSLEQDERIAKLCHRSLLCKTVSGNRCDLLTITGRCDDVFIQKQRPAVVVSARIHPGESNSSFVCHGLIAYLVADTPEAALLRNTYVFKIVPMINPDGVIHGNYRCSVVGTDLNRRFGDTHQMLHPTVYAMRHLLHKTQQHRGILLYLDLHGHSKKKNAFLYGCDLLQQPGHFASAAHGTRSSEDISQQRIFARVFPKILCSVNRSDVQGQGYFSYNDCTFSVSGDKGGTGRVVSWREMGIQAAYTVEVSFCSGGDNKERRLLKGTGRPRGAEENGKERTEEDIALANGGGGGGGGGSAPSTARSGGGGGSSCPTSPSRGAKAAPLSSPALAPVTTLEELMRSYKRRRHYGKRDLLNMGRDVCLSLFHFSNLRDGQAGSVLQDTQQLCPTVAGPSLTPASGVVEDFEAEEGAEGGEGHGRDGGEDGDGEGALNKRPRRKSLGDARPDGKRGGKKKKDRQRKSQAAELVPAVPTGPAAPLLLLAPETRTNACTSGIQRLASLLHTRVLCPAVLTPEALNGMLRDLAAATDLRVACAPPPPSAPSTILLGSAGVLDPNRHTLGLGESPSLAHLGLGLRASSELSIRRLLGLTEGLVLPDESDEEGEGSSEGDGSDSEPSVDNVRLEEDALRAGKKFQYSDLKTLRTTVRDITRRSVMRAQTAAAEEEAMRLGDAEGGRLKVAATSERLQAARTIHGKTGNVANSKRPDPPRRNASLPVLSTVNLNDSCPEPTNASNPYAQDLGGPVVPVIPAWSLRNRGGRRSSFSGRLATVEPMLQVPATSGAGAAGARAAPRSTRITTAPHDTSGGTTRGLSTGNHGLIMHVPDRQKGAADKAARAAEAQARLATMLRMQQG